MKSNLLIIGAGLYGLVAKEIAESMDCFEKIGFIDDNAKIAPDGGKILGEFSDVKALCNEYDSVIVAIGNPDARLSMLEKLKNDNCFSIVTLISPLAYISPTADIAEGCIIEPMAVVHTKCVISRGCIISAGAVVNHASVCEEGVHVDCNATVAGYTTVPTKTKVMSGTVFSEKK